MPGWPTATPSIARPRWWSATTPRPEQGKGYLARQLGVPVISDAQFLDCVRAVVGGTSMEEFTDVTAVDEQFALF